MLDRSQILDPDVLKHTVLDFRQMSVFVQNPLIFERAEGVHYWDVNGKHYWDGLSGIFVVAVGHRNQRIINAVKEQMERLSFAPTLHGGNVPAVELSALLAELAPGDLNTVKLASTGSEATEAAMKLARQYWKQAGKPGKYKVISRYFGYHGGTFGAMAASGTPSRKMAFEPFPAGFIHVPTVHCYRCPFNMDHASCNVFCAEYLRHIIAMEGPDTVSAVILEPIGNTGGILTPPPGYLPRIRQICDELNVLLIFDEMITGMGRTGEWFAAQSYGVTPDILCMGKGLSSGYAPLAALVWNDKIQSAFWGPAEAGIEFGHGHTYAAHPPSCAAGIASISEIRERNLIGNGREMGKHLVRRLQDMGQRYGIFGEIRGKGFLWGVELVKDTATKEQFPAHVAIGKQIGAEAQERGLITRHDPHWIAMAPPLVTTRDELDSMCDILDEAIGAVLDRL